MEEQQPGGATLNFGREEDRRGGFHAAPAMHQWSRVTVRNHFPARTSSMALVTD